MMKTLLISLPIYLQTCLNCFSQNLIDSLLIDGSRHEIEDILRQHYNFETMFFRFSKGSEQNFFKENGNVNLSKALFIYIDYSDTSRNIKNGIKVLLIDSETHNYIEYSEFWYVDYRKAGHKGYPGSMTNNGFGWIQKGKNLKKDEVISSIICLTF